MIRRWKETLVWGIVCILLVSANPVLIQAKAKAKSISTSKSVIAQSNQRIIVKLARPYTTDATLPASERRLQRSAIIGAQQKIEQALNLTTQQSLEKAEVVHYKTIPYMALTVTPAQLAQLRQNQLVEAIYPNQTYSVPILEGDYEGVVDSADSHGLMKTANAWGQGIKGQGQIVAVIDTGVYADHPYVAGKVIQEACFSVNNECRNGSSEDEGPGSSQAVLNVNSDGYYHGMHVAGIIAGEAKNFQGSGQTLSGVAPSAKIMAINVFGSSTSGAYDSDILQALEYVYNKKDSYTASGLKIASVNLSLGSSKYKLPCSQLSIYQDMIDSLTAARIAIVAAAGNEYFKNSLDRPACLNGVISVGATGQYVDQATGKTVEKVSMYSNSSDYLTVLAPGTNIVSSVYEGDADPIASYNLMSGTSMASPQVAGVFALLRQKYPKKSVAELISILTGKGNLLTDVNGIAKPRVNLTFLGSANAQFRGILATAQRPVWGGRTLTWLSVPDADGYMVRLYDQRGFKKNVYVSGGTAKSYDWSSIVQTNGIYYATVQAMSTGADYANGKVSSASAIKLTRAPYLENFENTDASKLTLKAVGDPTLNSWTRSSTIPYYAVSSPYSIYSGKYVFGTFNNVYDEAGVFYNYHNDNSIAVSNSGIAKLAAAKSARLHFQAFYVIEKDYDEVRLEMSGDNGGNWQEVAAYTGDVDPNLQYAQSEYIPIQVTIPSWAKTDGFRYRFVMVSDDDNEVSDLSPYDNYYEGMYIDQIFIEATYPALKAPAPSWGAGGTAKWTAITGNGGYSLKLFRGTTEIYSQLVSSTTTSIDLSSYITASGSYTTQIRVESNDKTNAASPFSTKSAAMVPLAKVSKPVWSGDSIRWSGVSGATGYTIRLYRGSTLMKTVKVGSTIRSYNLGSYMTAGSSYKVRVQATNSSSAGILSDFSLERKK